MCFLCLSFFASSLHNWGLSYIHACNNLFYIVLVKVLLSSGLFYHMNHFPVDCLCCPGLDSFTICYNNYRVMYLCLCMEIGLVIRLKFQVIE